MTRYRLHVFLPPEGKVPADADGTEKKREELERAFEELFEPVEGVSVLEEDRELVSEVFEDPRAEMDRIEEFERACHEIYPEASVIRTGQERDVMDGRGEEHGYDEALILQVTYAIGR